MTSRSVRLRFTTCFFALALALPAQTPGPGPAVPPGAKAPVDLKPPGDEMIPSFKISGLPIDGVLSALELHTGRSILRPAALPTAEYTLIIDRPIPRSELILAIETLLALNQIGVAPLGDRFLKVVALAQVRTEAPEMIVGSAFDQPASGKIATKVFQLDFLRVTEFMPQVGQLLTPGVAAQPVILEKANAALITDSVSNLQRIESLIKSLDRPATTGLNPKFYPLKSAKASDLVNKLRTILQGTLQNQLGTSTTYNADDRTNQIILIADPRQYPFFDELIAKLDVKADPNTRNEVLYLKHAAAKDVSTLLTQLVTGQTNAAQKTSAQSVRPGQITLPGQPAATPQPATGPQPAVMNNVGAEIAAMAGSNEFSTLVTVTYDERSNAVIVSGTGDDIRLIKDLVDKIDIILAQVRLEVVIAEVTLDDNSTTGIGALGLKLDGDKLVGFAGSAAGAGVATAGPGVAITRPTATNNVSGSWDLAGELAISATPRKNNTNILSSPSITTTHNKEAIFFFGETRPVISGVTSTAGVGTSGLSTQSNVTQQEIGTTITIKPLIGTDGTVQLDIKQDISEVTGTVQIDNNTQYIIGKRKTTSYVTSRSGQILVLAGYQKNKDSRNTSRLGPIPIIGDLLGGRTNAKNRIELVIFLRPVVLTNTPTDNLEAMKRVDTLEQKELVRQRLDPSYVPPKKSIIEKAFGN